MQAGPVPQPQLPSARHWFELFAEQVVVQAFPLMPQLGQAGLALQVVELEQQPLQLLEVLHSQLPVPPLQWRPGPQAAVLPHWHTPGATHWFAVKVLQAVQVVEPAGPHSETEMPTQTLLTQQPEGHEVALQTQVPLPVSHSCPALQLAQAAPPVPQVDWPWVLHWWAPSQQPLGQEVPSHTQLPPLQRCPAAQAAFAPHLHWPPEQVSVLLGSQLVQAAPLRPQASTVGGAVPTLPVQHPVGQEVASHTQLPPLQRWPAPQAALAPHLHWPPAQVSALLASQATQLAPLVPQVLVLGVLHRCAASQQPPAHEVELHTQVPPEHSWPATQAAPPPQVQVPLALQPSAFERSQLAQAAPLTPQALAVGGLVHALLAQQPVGQEVASQTQVPPLQR